jgi:hypothetical protein
MDKSWLLAKRNTLKYELGVEQFLQWASENATDPKRFPCPCSRCGNVKKKSVKVIRGHLFGNGFLISRDGNMTR